LTTIVDGLAVAHVSEGMMLQSLSDNLLADQLIRIAREPELRHSIYDRLGEYCHQCRNRLNSLKLSLYLVMRQSPGTAEGRWDEIERHYQSLEQRVDQIQTLCRPVVLSRVTLSLDLLIDDRRKGWIDLMARSGKTLGFERPAEPSVISFDVDRIGQAIDSLVALRAGDLNSGSSATIRWWKDASLVHFRWEESVMPGASTKTSGTTEEETWTLPLLVRIVMAHGGEVRIENDSGYRLELSWPTSPPTP
jgi:hypothetical protein